MRILAIESTAKAASAAVLDNGRLVSQYWQKSGLTHSRTLLKMVEDMLANLELKMADIDLVAVAKGPGSFTGVRIGVAAAKGLAWAADKPVCGVSTLEAMAYPLSDRDGIICPVMDARRGQVYNALFSGGEALARITPDRAISLEELTEEAKKSGKTYFLVGDGAEMCYNAIKEAGVDVRLAPEPLLFQSAYGVAAAAVHAEQTSPDELVPNYLRLSQAERERLEREKSITNGGKANG